MWLYRFLVLGIYNIGALLRVRESLVTKKMNRDVSSWGGQFWRRADTQWTKKPLIWFINMHVEFRKNRIIARITIVTYSDLSWHKIQTTCSFLYSGKTIDKELLHKSFVYSRTSDLRHWQIFTIFGPYKILPYHQTKILILHSCCILIDCILILNLIFVC